MASLRELREKAGKTRVQVAADLDMSERHLYRLEHGYPIKKRVALAFAAYYGVPVDDIDYENGVAA